MYNIIGIKYKVVATLILIVVGICILNPSDVLLLRLLYLTIRLVLRTCLTINWSRYVSTGIKIKS